MAHGFNIRVIIKITLRKMLGSAVLLILYTDSKSLYNYLIKFGITQKKQLMVDMMSLCQSYKRWEITKIRWIYRRYNLMNSIIKAKLSSALKILINTNCIDISIIKWLKHTSTDI